MTAHMKIKNEALIIMKSYLHHVDPTSCDILNQSEGKGGLGGKTHSLVCNPSFFLFFFKNLCPLNAQKQKRCNFQSTISNAALSWLLLRATLIVPHYIFTTLEASTSPVCILHCTALHYEKSTLTRDETNLISSPST